MTQEWSINNSEGCLVRLEMVENYLRIHAHLRIIYFNILRGWWMLWNSKRIQLPLARCLEDSIQKSKQILNRFSIADDCKKMRNFRKLVFLLSKISSYSPPKRFFNPIHSTLGSSIISHLLENSSKPLKLLVPQSFRNSHRSTNWPQLTCTHTQCTSLSLSLPYRACITRWLRHEL